jgi:hypothetical protein
MKTLISATLAFSFLSTAALADEIFICTDQNTSLQFNVYEDAAGIHGGNMYIEGIQVANLGAYRMNQYTMRATVEGNAAGTEFILNADRQAVYVTIGDTVRKVCSAAVSH